MIQVRSIQGKGDDPERLHIINEYFYSLLKPKIFWGSGGIEAQFDKGFEMSCDTIAKSRNRDPKRLTAFEYLQTLEAIRQEQKREQGTMRKNRSGRR
jgi:hypothetical protein